MCDGRDVMEVWEGLMMSDDVRERWAWPHSSLCVLFCDMGHARGGSVWGLVVLKK